MPNGPKNYRFDDEREQYVDSQTMRRRMPGQQQIQPVSSQPFSKGQAQPYTGMAVKPAPYGGAPYGFAESLAAAGQAMAESPHQQLYQQRMGDIYGQLDVMGKTPGAGIRGPGRMPTIATPEWSPLQQKVTKATAEAAMGLVDKNPYSPAAIVARENIMRGSQQFTDMAIDKQAIAGNYYGTARHQREKEMARHQMEQNVELTRQQMIESGAQYNMNAVQVMTQFKEVFDRSELGMEELRQRADFKRADIQTQYKRMAMSAASSRMNNAFKILTMKMQVAGLQLKAPVQEMQMMTDNYWRATSQQFEEKKLTIAQQTDAKNRQHQIDLARMAGKSKTKSSIFKIFSKVIGGVGGFLLGGPVGAGLGASLLGGVGSSLGGEEVAMGQNPYAPQLA